MDSKRQLKRTGTSLNNIGNADGHGEGLVFSHPPHPNNMPYQSNEAKDGAVYMSKNNTLSRSNANQTDQQTMSSQFPPQQGGLKDLHNLENQRDIGIWVKSWKLNHLNSTSHLRITTSGQGSTAHAGQYQLTAAPNATWPECRVPPTTEPKKQPDQGTSPRSWPSTSACNGIQTSPGNGSARSLFEWQMTSGADGVPFSTSTMGEIERSGVESEPLLSGYLLPPNITGWMERHDTGYYPYYPQDMHYSGIQYLDPQSHPWTDISCSTMASIPTQRPTSQWEANNEGHSPDYGFYCSPGSPFSSALSSAATPDLPLTATNPETLVASESIYLEDADLDNVNERQFRGGSSSGTDTDGQFALSSGANEGRSKRKGFRSSPQRNDDRDAFLIKCKLAGMSYKEIKAKGKFTVAESTLRGRFRSLTKRKELRVRKPGWQESDVSIYLKLENPSINQKQRKAII
ncbi:hypothetical protein FQN49_003981 [Arthroderma sp. PD_2]|nr:hypothetical protein FQN49_003981 [Arthroderma sp. PD_2]